MKLLLYDSIWLTVCQTAVLYGGLRIAVCQSAVLYGRLWIAVCQTAVLYGGLQIAVCQMQYALLFMLFHGYLSVRRRLIDTILVDE